MQFWIILSIYSMSAIAQSNALNLFKAPLDKCRISFAPEVSTYSLSCQVNGQSVSEGFYIDPKNLSEVLPRMLDLVKKHSQNPDLDEAELKKHVLGYMEEKFRYSPGDDLKTIKNGLKVLAQGNVTPDPQMLDCLEQSEKAPLNVTPFIDVRLDKKSEAEVLRQMSDQQMQEQGFLNLGKLEGVTIEFDTKNDNFFHGAAMRAKHGANKENVPDSDYPWWEGDDRGLTFAAKKEGKADFEKGSIRAAAYTRGYGKLDPQTRTGRICYLRLCQTFEEQVYQDENGRWYQKFVTVDGLEVEYKRNKVNGDMYVKVSGSIERLSDSKGIAQKIQTKWHEVSNSKQYNNLDHMEDKVRAQVGIGVGTETSKEINSWLRVKGAIEGNAQLSTDGMKNSYVGVMAELTVDSNRLLTSSSKTPALEATLKMAGQSYGKNSKPFTQLGVRLTGTIYSDRHGNIVQITTGMEKYEDPLSREYGTKEKNFRHFRADYIHSYGIQYKKELK